jgi:4-amino-4-deoxy-L-arabinose transferase-like glycosyltransferase
MIVLSDSFQPRDGTEPTTGSSGSAENGNRFRIKIFGFFLVFLILAGWHFYHGINEPSWYRPPLSHGDGPDYESIAYSIAQGDGFQFAWQSESWQKPYREDSEFASYSQIGRVDWPGPTTSRPPLYPALIAMVYQVIPRGPVSFAAVRSISILCTALSGSLAVILAFDIARVVLVARWLSIVAALSTMVLALLDRTIRSYSVDFLTEPLAMLWCTVLLWSGLRWQSGYRQNFWFLCIVISLTTLILTRSMMVFWLPGMALIVGVTADRSRVRWGVFLLLCVVVCLFPWWVRNCIVTQRLMPLGGQGAASLSGGYCDESLADRGNWHSSVEDELQRQIDTIPDSQGWTQAQREVALADLAMERTKGWILDHQYDIPKLMTLRVATHWGPFHGTSLLWRLGIVAGWLALILLRSREVIWILGLPIISTATVAILYETGGRFLVPLYGILYMTAGLGVAFVVRLVFSNLFLSCRKNGF